MPMCEHEALCALHSSRAELRRDVGAGSNKMERPDDGATALIWIGKREAVLSAVFTAATHQQR